MSVLYENLVHQVNVALLYEEAVDAAPDDHLRAEDITNIDGPVRRGKEIVREMMQLLGSSETNKTFLDELKKIDESLGAKSEFVRIKVRSAM